MGNDAEQKPPLTVEKRRLVKIGGSTYISLPPKFMEAHGLKAGDEIPVLANHILKIVPMPEAGDRPNQNEEEE